MGGKTKTQRTKNNAKPSNSSRSAELLGSTTLPTFVGFSAHSDFGLVPFAPGFTKVENLESFEAKLSPQFQVILRKLSKKDPITKKKAMQELIELVNASDVETVKTILPLWPKFYQNLAFDSEHNVRELAQTILQILVSKCKRAVAPYIKHLLPVWLASQFDNYAPSASIATSSFCATFIGSVDRTQEVLLHCQSEIMEYTHRNLTFHTAATLASEKGLSPEESEQKYQRFVVSSLKTLSFFIKHTSKAEDLTQVQLRLQDLIDNQKFWSYAKHKVMKIKAAWFEFVCQLLQSSRLLESISKIKIQLVTVSFQNIDESDPLVAPYVWECILLLQSTFDDWYVTLNFRKTILPKLSLMLRQGFNNNVQAACPNLLPFFSKLSQNILQDVNFNAFQKQFFDDLKSAIYMQNSNSKSDYATIIRTYFECLRFVLNKIKNDDKKSPDDKKYTIELLTENILEPLEHFVSIENVVGKNFFQQTSALVTFWADRRGDDTCLYMELLDLFWKRIFTFITNIEKNKEVEECYLANVIDLIQCLRTATVCFDEQKVKFAETNEQKPPVNKGNDSQKTSASIAFIDTELKLVVITLLRICLDSTSKQKSSKYINYISRLAKMFFDAEFYARISPHQSIPETLNLFVNLIERCGLNDEACEIMLDVIFDIMHKQEKAEQFTYIENCLLKIPRSHVQTLVLQQLLSYPLCVEPNARTMLSQPAISGIIAEVAREVVSKKAKEKLNLLHKCFFQTESGEILIGATTVDTILDILSHPLTSFDDEDMLEACGSFIAQIMPVVCSNGNSSKAVRHNVFLKLFKFTMERTVSDYISEDTLWEITTCWQDALSSEDIIVDAELLQSCGAIVQECLGVVNITTAAVQIKADAMAKFIICSTETVSEDDERYQKIDKALMAFFNADIHILQTMEKVKNYNLFLEALKNVVTPCVDLNNVYTEFIDLNSLFRRFLLNICTIIKLVCKENTGKKIDDVAYESEDEITEDYCDPNENLITHCSDFLLTEVLKCINLAAIGDSLINFSPQLGVFTETTILELSEKVKMFLKSESNILEKVMEEILQQAAQEKDSIHCRSLSLLVHCQKFAQFDENATILLAEELSEYFIARNALKAYVNSLQYLLPNLEPKVISLQSPIMQTNPSDIWIKAAIFRCVIFNNFEASLNEGSDKRIIMSALQFITAIMEKQNVQKATLLYNVDVQNQSFDHVNNAVEYINLLVELLNRFPYELTIKHWDAIRIGLSSWVLSISKSIDSATTKPKVGLFTVSVFKLFAALTKFVTAEKQKSSTEFLSNVIEEWEKLFAREVNLVLFKSFYRLYNITDINEESLVDNSKERMECCASILEEIDTAVELIDYSIVYNFCKHSTTITLDNVCNFLLKNFSNPISCIRNSCVYILKQLMILFVSADSETIEKQIETIENQGKYPKIHFLHRLEDYITRFDLPIRKYLNEFSFKLTELGYLEPINHNEAFSFLFLWDCIIFACAHAPVSLRCVYTDWLNENKYEENLLHFLFRAMPVEILKNHDSKIMNTDLFRGLSWTQVKDKNLTLEKYVCHLYAEVLRKLPAVLRRWWSRCPSRQKTFVDKLTTNFVSPLICNEELKAIVSKKEKHENMQVTVHTSTREVLAVYSIDEARMELVITLAQNYPLGGVKVECGKQIGGRSTSRNVGMQLTIFLTHQNGTIFDGLSLWKKNLDKKFEGVEECYVCYTVIHQDTCQLPKLTCKTCKKKFHGPCLYKWFTTSSKSTCPICRNVF